MNNPKYFKNENKKSFYIKINLFKLTAKYSIHLHTYLNETKQSK